MRRILIAFGVMAVVFLQTTRAQDNNQSINEDLKKVWGTQGSGTGLNMDGIYNTQTNDDGPGDPSESDPAETPPTELPVDGGIGFLLAAGLGYGANRLRRRRKDKV